MKLPLMRDFTAASASAGLPSEYRARSRGRQSRAAPEVAQERVISTFSAPASILAGLTVTAGEILEMEARFHWATGRGAVLVMGLDSSTSLPSMYQPWKV